MRTTLFCLLCLIGIGFSASAQRISKNALGLRIGDDDGFGAEISYQRALFESNRLEFNLGIRSGNNYDGFKLTALHQWLFPLDGNFNWYVGAGGGAGVYSIDNDLPGNDDTDSFAFIAGNAGIEYNFNIPLILSIDVRPEIGFGDFNDDFDFDLGLGIRYQF
ncbi:hypothetical protein [Gilvibacter sediminis]|uniref:hypothetical protein n=1 Tax=Gilvibacter sediminis TaxID=379071 RepID=UPI002350C2B9|nr:hypothetical protein [Gilvibacter sediminis]MDC7998359.1 hypothetical protein [Gilvibacter sediminis]